MWFILASLLLFLGLRWYPYLSTSVPMGYDAGLYLYLLKEYQKLPLLSYTSLSQWVIGQFPVGIAVIGRLLTPFVSPEKLLVPLIVLFCILLFVSVYMFSRQAWGKKYAVWSVFFLSVSAIQFHTYWYFYAKQILASSLLLFALYFFLRSSYLAIFFGIGIAYIHEPTFIVLVCALVAGFITDKTKRRYYMATAIYTAIGATAYYLPNYAVTIGHYVAPVISSVIPQVAGGTLGRSSGTFYSTPTAFLFMLPYLPLAIIGILKQWKNKRSAPLMGALVGSLTIVIFGLFLSRRFIIFADLFMILYAGYGAVLVAEKYKKARFIRPLLTVYALLLLTFIGVFVSKTGKPEIFDDEISEIMMLRQTEPEAWVLVTDEKYMPYVYGWSERKTIAPGYGQYDIFWTIPQWHEFWESNDREKEKELLMKLPKPLYIYRGDRVTPVYTDYTSPCFEKINWRTFRFICSKTQ